MIVYLVQTFNRTHKVSANAANADDLMVTFSLNCNVGKMSQIQSLQFTGSFVACLAFALDTILQPWLAHCSIKAVEYVDEPDHALSQFYIKHQLRFTDLSSELRTFFST